ncbi:MAG: type 2 lanthipeptide synthetase LanM family protein [Nostoc sp. DedQUE04]|uniref:type 2 lanthipeptide synthetase LanM family protein n=1 Tax=Nostoc sp. DedQUE04 TaxID=3075390 RepID=UPI002AD3D287|nr:type 2 lanthipeptide synthetase LanM family protein [Nostoc sp. DedQUE04]MDZ8138087.1 type 2 lanthipeptide synthetase LanM family protein [Nostoc sp. DedQUE04]
MNAVISSISTQQLPAIANPVISTAQLHSIVSRASNLFERLDRQIFLPSAERNEKLLQSRLDTWCQTVAKGNFEHFQQYLQWDGLNLETAKNAIAPVCLRHDAPLPNWAKTLSAVLNLAFSQAATNPDPTTSHRFLISQSPLPFEEILVPFVLFAQQELIARTGESYQRLTDEVHGVFERSLLGQLIDIATQPLQIAFSSWRVAQQSSFTRLLTQTQELQSRSLYIRFVREMLQGKLISFFVEYAALARLLATTTELWVESQLEFLHHLDADWSEIAEKFNNGLPLGQVTSVQPLRSDPHHGRRSVITLKIEPNLRLVYKPKHLGVERAYNQLLAWLNEQGSPLPLKTLQVINRDSHGWVEFVTSQACEDTAQIKRHYQRAGMLLCLVYVLDATDCHYENIIASGEHPVLIDTETVMQHRPKNESWANLQTAQQLAFHRVDNSVMRTALLPVWHPASNGNSGFDFSGLGSHNQGTRHYKGLQWSSVNTDHQFIAQQQRFQFQPTELSLFDGKLGIALFLAAVEHIKKDGEFRELCLGALQEFRQALSKIEQPKGEFSNLNLGLSAGLGGWIYSLTKIGQFLNDDRLLADALNLAYSIVPEAITSDRSLDIAGGTAGTLLSLLALYQVVGDPVVLESACLIGRHLLAQSVITSKGRAWKTLDGRLLTGFSHGAAGIAYALLKLAQVTNDAEFRAAAAEAIAYEQSIFLPEVGNWPDLRDFSKFLQATAKSESSSLMSSWCHGATGIGLARLGGLPMLSTEAIHQDIQVAIKTTQKQLTQKRGIVNQLCCGQMGQIELLLCAASRLGKPDLLTNARVHALQIVQQARHKGYYLEPALHSSVYVPGLFRGEVGIGYTLLRLTHLEQLPSILLWE